MTTTTPHGNFAVAITESDIHNAAVTIRAAMVEADPDDVPALAVIEAATRDALIDLMDYACTNAASLALDAYKGISEFKHGFEKSLAWQSRNRKAAK